MMMMNQDSLHRLVLLFDLRYCGLLDLSKKDFRLGLQKRVWQCPAFTTQWALQHFGWPGVWA